MVRKILIFVVSIVIPVLLTQLPIFPLVVELREITETGEALLQEWTFVSMPEFYDAARFDLWLMSAGLYYFQSAIHRRVRSALALAWWGRFDRFRYDLWLPDYASIQPALRQQFEQEVYLSNRREVRELVINGAACQRP